MICGERGVLPKSQYFFFSPSEQFLKYNYGVVNCGHFYCHFGYRREREGNAYPLFIYVAEGELHLEHDSQHEVAKKGEIFLIDCSKPHAYYIFINNFNFNIFILPDVLPMRLQKT